MTSLALPEFWECYSHLPVSIRARARKAYRIWRDDPRHPGLRFKCVSVSAQIYSIRISRSHRARAVRRGDDFFWFWIGSHDEYERLIS